MKRETRANLVFLSIFLALTIPGAVILFKKKLDPAAPPMFMPDFVRRRLPYMAPQRTPAQVARFVPDLAGAWVTEVNREHGGGAQVWMHGRQPAISDDRVFQLTSIRQEASVTTFYLIAWDGGYGTEVGRYSAHVTAGSRSIPGRVRSAQGIPMPGPVKRELMNAGFVRPPATVTWLAVEFDGNDLTKNDPVVLQVSYRQGEGDVPLLSTLPVPTNAGSLTH